MALKIFKLVLLVIVFSCLFIDHTSALSKREISLMKKWAPMVFLAKGEKYRPSTVDFFLKYVRLSNSNRRLKSSNIPKCNSGCYLKTRQKMKKPLTDNLKFFKGQKPRSASAYAVLRKRNGNFEIYYWFLYPFNLGKRVCIGVYIKRCFGKYKRFGNHVADWEHIRVYLKPNGSPVKIAYYAHGGAHDYVYKNRRFVDKDGKRLSFYRGHPIVYSAKGSHGSRASSGKHTYKRLPNGFKIQDECSAGDRWQTWSRLKVVEYNKYKGWSNFINYQGRWGNNARGCGLFKIYKTISGQCELNPGPRGPSKMAKDD